MTDEATNLVLEQLRAIRGTLAQHTEEFSFVKARLGSIEHQLVGVHAGGATVNAQLESIKKPLDGIEKRLDLTDA